MIKFNTNKFYLLSNLIEKMEYVNQLNTTICDLIMGQTSSNNQERKNSEINFDFEIQKNPSLCASILINNAENERNQIYIRQSCLLHLKRIIPKYWSLGFDQFIGNAFNQDIKKIIKTKILNLSTRSPYSKIRSISSHICIQIALVEYPDEWPDFLDSLFQMINNHFDETCIVGSVGLFSLLYDEMISENQFWEEEICSQIIKSVFLILLKNSLSYKTKIAVSKLYKDIYSNIISPEAFVSNQRLFFMKDHKNSALYFFIEILRYEEEKVNNHEKIYPLIHLEYRSILCLILIEIISSSKDNYSLEIKKLLFNISLNDLNKTVTMIKNYRKEINDFSTMIDHDSCDINFQILFQFIIVIIKLISIMFNYFSISNDSTINFQNFIENLIFVSILTKESILNYVSNINLFIDDVNGLSSSENIRDVINDMLISMDYEDANKTFITCVNFLLNFNNKDWMIIEVYLFLLNSIILNPTLHLDYTKKDHEKIFYGIMNLFYKKDFFCQELVISKYFLLLPNFIQKFNNKVQVNSLITETMVNLFSFVINLSNNFKNEFIIIILFSVLICLNNFVNLFDLSEIIDSSKKKMIQGFIFNIILEVLDDSYEESLSVLIDSFLNSVNICPKLALTLNIDDNYTVIDLLFKLMYKDSNNVFFFFNVFDCLSILLKNLNLIEFKTFCDKSMTIIFDILQKNIELIEIKFSPDLYLTLQFLKIIIQSIPNSDNVFIDIYFKSFTFLKKLINLTVDDQILQICGETFNIFFNQANDFINRYNDSNSNDFGLDCVLEIIFHYLNPNLSDSAAIDIGLMNNSLFKNFQLELSMDLVIKILTLSSQRLFIAKELLIIQNLLFFFSNLFINSPSQITLILSKIKFHHCKNNEENIALNVILSVWFDHFDSIKGYENIKSSLDAFKQLFFLQDEKIQMVTVKGDLIINNDDKIHTRSYTKKNPEKYTQISAFLKILKLLTNELELEIQQNSNFNNGKKNYNDSDDSEWEDYLDSDGCNIDEKKLNFVKNNLNKKIKKSNDNQNEIKKFLINFFKELINEKPKIFQYYINFLTPKEKKIVAECANNYF